MTLQQLVEHLDELVHFKDDHLGIDGMYRYKGCIIRRNRNELYAVAELVNQDNFMIVAALDKVQFIQQPNEIREETTA